MGKDRMYILDKEGNDEPTLIMAASTLYYHSIVTAENAAGETKFLVVAEGDSFLAQGGKLYVVRGDDLFTVRSSEFIFTRGFEGSA